MRLAGSFGQPVFGGAAQHVINGRSQTYPVPGRNEKRLESGAGTQHGSDGFIAVNQGLPVAFLVTGFLIPAYQQ
jgi:hypothetical protein